MAARLLQQSYSNQADLIRGRGWESHVPARRREQRAEHAFPSSSQAYSAARLPPPGGRAERRVIDTGYPRAKFFCRWNQESSAPRLGFAQMDSQ
jgi:hypothetical protein